MIYLVAAQTVVLVLLAVLVAGLLRSHAEILRRLPDEEGETAGGSSADDFPELQLVAPPEREEDAFPAVDLSGETLEGDAIKVALTGGAPHTLLAFLSSGCLTCGSFWEAFDGAGALPGDARLVIVTKDSSYESPSKLEELAPDDVPLVMSSTAWEDYSVPVAPYFVYVGAGGQVLGEGAAEHWSQIESLFRDALRDLERSGQEGGGAPSAGGTSLRPPGERLDQEDATLAAAGVRPGDPSLYPAERDDSQRG